MRGTVVIKKLEIGTVTDGRFFLLPADLYIRALEGESGKVELNNDAGYFAFDEVEKLDETFRPDFLLSKGIQPLYARNHFEWDQAYGVVKGYTVVYFYDEDKYNRVYSVRSLKYPVVPFYSEFGVLMYDSSKKRVENVSLDDEIDNVMFLLSRRVERYYSRYGLNVTFVGPGEYGIVFDGDIKLYSKIGKFVRGVKYYVAMPDGLYVVRDSLMDLKNKKNRLFSWSLEKGEWVVINNLKGSVEFYVNGWYLVFDKIFEHYILRSTNYKYKIKYYDFEKLIEILENVATIGDPLIQ